MLMLALCPNRCIMAKDAENKSNSLTGNELSHSQTGNFVPNIFFAPVLDAKMMEKDENTFPLQSFPESLQEVIRQNKECLSFPVSYMGTSILFATSVAIGNTYRVVIKNGFDVPAVLYCALVGKPGVSKTHPLKFAIKPIMDWDRKHQVEYQQAMEQYNEYQNLDKAQKKNAEKHDKIPVLKKTMVQDFTPESLQHCHQKNLRGLGAYNDELIAFTNNFNRYNKGSAEQYFLSNHSGSNADSLRGELNKNVYIPYNFVSIGGTIQPIELKPFGEGRLYNGFLDRFLFDFPLGLKKEKWTDHELSDELIESYQSIVLKLLQIPFEGTPKYLTFEADARKKLFEWQHANTDLSNESQIDYETGICAKMDTQVPRIALILQILHDVCAEKETKAIELSNVEKAIELAEYYRENAKRVYDAILGEKGMDKKLLKEEQKKRSIELHKEGKSLSEIAKIIFGDEKKKPLIQLWLK
jgi:Protein of unknown function (DUF3987)